MKHPLIFFATALILASCGVMAPKQDKQVRTSEDNLFSKQDEYLSAIDRLSIPAACLEVDAMISSVQDSVLRDSVAVRSYRHFRNSKVMGSENVAVHIYDAWFASYKTLFSSIDEFEEAGLFALINRQSLIGSRVPELTMSDIEGNEVTFPFRNARKSIIYFYSTKCPKCLLISLELKAFVLSEHPDADIIAVYTGDDIVDWNTYVADKLNFPSSSANVCHLRGGESDFVMVYGVIQTPRLFLLDESGVVIGRHLDVDALSKLLH